MSSEKIAIIFAIIAVLGAVVSGYYAYCSYTIMHEVGKLRDNTHYNGITTEYTNSPRLRYPEEIYYSGAGPNWDTDLDDNRYFKKFNHLFLDCNHQLTGYFQDGQVLTHEVFDAGWAALEQNDRMNNLKNNIKS